jgi:uncharacterized membrane protein SirB2
MIARLFYLIFFVFWFVAAVEIEAWKVLPSREATILSWQGVPLMIMVFVAMFQHYQTPRSATIWIVALLTGLVICIAIDIHLFFEATQLPELIARAMP